MTEQTKTIKLTSNQLEALQTALDIVGDIDSVWERFIDAELVDPEACDDSPLTEALEALQNASDDEPMDDATRDI